MADADQLDVLKKGAGAWNAWRAENRSAPVELSGGALRGLDLGGADLCGADLTGADLRGTILDGADLARARLAGANLFKATLAGADLEGADLRAARFLNCAQLESAQNWQSARRDPDLACGAAIPEP